MSTSRGPIDTRIGRLATSALLCCQMTAGSHKVGPPGDHHQEQSVQQVKVIAAILRVPFSPTLSWVPAFSSFFDQIVLSTNNCYERFSAGLFYSWRSGMRNLSAPFNLLSSFQEDFCLSTYPTWMPLSPEKMKLTFMK